MPLPGPFRYEQWVKPAAYLGLTVPTLHAGLSGQTLVGLAQRLGKSPSGLQQAILSATQARLAKAQAAGRVSATQAGRWEPALAQWASRLMSHRFRQPTGTNAG